MEGHEGEGRDVAEVLQEAGHARGRGSGEQLGDALLVELDADAHPVHDNLQQTGREIAVFVDSPEPHKVCFAAQTDSPFRLAQSRPDWAQDCALQATLKAL